MKVMVAADGSEGSLYALQWTLHNSLFTLQHVNITLIHVQQPFNPTISSLGFGGAAYSTPPSVVESMRKSQQENSAGLLSRAIKMCNDKMVKAETVVLEGDAKEMICQATEQNHVDLLVAGSRGLGKIKRAFLGSVSDYCAHHAKCPILIVKPPREQLSK